MRNHQLWDLYNEERQRLQAKLALRIQSNMSSLVGDACESSTADVLLVAADGRKLAAHICILRQRAPVFFQRYIEPTLNATPRNKTRELASTSNCPTIEVAVGDVDSAGLAFFIHSVYTEEEVKQLGEVQFSDSASPQNDNNDSADDNNEGGNNSGRGQDDDRKQSYDSLNVDRNCDTKKTYLPQNTGNKNDAATTSQKRHCTLSEELVNYQTFAANNNNSSKNFNANQSEIGITKENFSSSTDSLNDRLPKEYPIAKKTPEHTLNTSYGENSPFRQQSMLNYYARPQTFYEMPQFNAPNCMSASLPSPSDLKTIEEDGIIGGVEYYTSKSIKNHRKITSAGYEAPIMTSFRELAVSSATSSRCNSVQQLNDFGGNSPAKRNIDSGHYYNVGPTEEGNSPSISQNNWQLGERTGLDRRILGPDTPVPQHNSPSHSHSRNGKIFPMFINWNADVSGGVGGYLIEEGQLMSQSFPQNSMQNLTALNNSSCDSGTSSFNSSSLNSSMVSSGYAPTALTNSTLRSRTLTARRLSVTSLTSLNSIDFTPSNYEGPIPPGDRNATSQLAADLLKMYYNKADADTMIIAEDGELPAHRCILSTSCAFFRQQLKLNPNRVELKGFSKSSINFLLLFLYGGITCFTPDDEIDVWKIIALSIHLNLEDLTEVAILHLKTYKCHFFHKPCATCVSAVFDALPHFHTIKCLRRLYDEALRWQARHFSRIWKGRVFSHLSEYWQKECFNALLEEITEENVIDVLLGCEKLQVSLPRVKSQHAAYAVLTLVSDVVEYCTEFLIMSFNLLIASKSYRNHGMGLALNLSLLEDVLPSLIHNLSADVAVRTFINLQSLISDIQKSILRSSTTDNNSNLDINQENCRSLSNIPFSMSFHSDEYHSRFLNLNRRLFELTDRHLLHYAALVVKCDAWNLLNQREQNRVKECGIFVEMQMARAPPPRFSSFNRTYKRSSSAGVHVFSPCSERTRSLERTARPATTFTCLIEEAPPEQITEVRRKSDNTHTSFRRSESLKGRSSSGDCHKKSLTHIIQQKANQAFSKIPTAKSTKSSHDNIDRTDTKMKEKKEIKAVSDGTENKRSVPITENIFPTKNSADIISTKDDTNNITKCKENNLKDNNETKNVPQKQALSNNSQRNGTTSQKNTSAKVVSRNQEGAAEQKKIDEEEMQLQRQNTHTVMTVQQNREAGIDPIKMGVPQATHAPVSLQAKSNKPHSVVRPMLKDPPLAIAATPALSILAAKTTDAKTKSSKTKSPNKEDDQAVKNKANTVKNGRSGLPRLLNPVKMITKPSENDITSQLRYQRPTICSTQGNAQKSKISDKTKSSTHQNPTSIKGTTKSLKNVGKSLILSK